MSVMIVLIVALVCLMTQVSAARVTLPDENVLEEWLLEVTTNHFLEKTTIVEDLSGKKKPCLGVFNAVTFAMSDY